MPSLTHTIINPLTVHLKRCRKTNDSREKYGTIWVYFFDGGKRLGKREEAKTSNCWL